MTPSHHYPLGSVFSLDRRLALGGLGPQIPGRGHRGRRRQRPTVRPTPRRALHHLDSEGRIVYAGTFSKILSPSLRMAFAVLPPRLVPAVVALRQAMDGGPSAMLDGALARFIDEGHLRRTYQFSDGQPGSSSASAIDPTDVPTAIER